MRQERVEGLGKDTRESVVGEVDAGEVRGVVCREKCRVCGGKGDGSSVSGAKSVRR